MWTLQSGNLKIADFGLCSVYKYKGKQRELNGACGSLPYIAPEVSAAVSWPWLLTFVDSTFARF